MRERPVAFIVVLFSNIYKETCNSTVTYKIGSGKYSNVRLMSSYDLDYKVLQEKMCKCFWFFLFDLLIYQKMDVLAKEIRAVSQSGNSL